MPPRCRTALRVAGTALFAAAILLGVLLAYVTGYQFVRTERHHLSFGLYGAALALHLALQALFAYLEHRRTRRAAAAARRPPATPSVALCIAAYQEDPGYLRKCLRSARRISYPGLKVVLVIDGNRPEDQYMVDIFREVMGGGGGVGEEAQQEEEAGAAAWDGNYHAEGGRAEDAERVAALVRGRRYSCVAQRWGGKREVMYTAFRALGDSVDYVQVCDSDTVLDPACTVEMLRILEEDPEVGGVGGDVQILNKYDSWISFLSSVRYWTAFNVERACQSYFGCVQCISGPLGMYRNALLQTLLEPWYGQTFLGARCSFGDDRHLTNRVLSLGYKTRFAPRARCLTETPAAYLRWLNQQTRWSKSYFREWLYNALWFHKHSPWMTYESVVTGFFPFFLAATVVQLFYRGRLWGILLFLLTVQLVGAAKAAFACFLRGRPVMAFMSLYSLLYMSSLLPAKVFALLTINRAGWGTSGRRRLVANFAGAVPVAVWAAVLLGGAGYTAYREAMEPPGETERAVLVAGAALYACYWVVLVALYFAVVAKRRGKAAERCPLQDAEV